MLWIPLDNLRKALRVEIREDDAELARLVKAARDHIENVTGLSLGTASKVQYLPSFRDFIIEGAPDPQITSVTFTRNGLSQTLHPSRYRLRRWAGPLAVLVFEDAGDADPDSIAVNYTCGFGFAVPHDLIQAGVALVAHWYTNVEAAAPVDLRPVPFSAQVILERRSIRGALL